MSLVWEPVRWPDTEIDRTAFRMASEELYGNGLPVEALTRFVVRRATEIKCDLLSKAATQPKIVMDTVPSKRS